MHNNIEIKVGDTYAIVYFNECIRRYTLLDIIDPNEELVKLKSLESNKEFVTFAGLFGLRIEGTIN